jgi:hypothetical protein
MAEARRWRTHLAPLLVPLGCFALTGYAVSRLADDPWLPRMLVWFIGAVTAHDLIAFPLYSLVDRIVRAGPARRGRAHRSVPLVNYVRVPTAGMALLFVVYLPGIIRQGGATYLAATGQTQAPFLARWLLCSAGMFVLSAIVYTVRSACRRHRS